MVKRITGGNVFDVTVSQNIRKNGKSSNKEFPILLGCVVYHRLSNIICWYFQEKLDLFMNQTVTCYTKVNRHLTTRWHHYLNTTRIVRLNTICHGQHLSSMLESCIIQWKHLCNVKGPRLDPVRNHVLDHDIIKECVTSCRSIWCLVVRVVQNKCYLNQSLCAFLNLVGRRMVFNSTLRLIHHQ